MLILRGVTAGRPEGRPLHCALPRDGL